MLNSKLKTTTGRFTPLREKKRRFERILTHF
jgi:hypothetical protein